MEQAKPADAPPPPITHYTIYATGGGTTRKKVKVVQAPPPGAPPPAFVTGLKKETAYTFEVTASNSRFESAPSTASASVTTLPTKKHLFISDFANDRVLRFDYATKNFVDVFVAKGSGGLSGPRGIAFNPFDDADQPRSFYVSSDNKVLMYDSCDGSFVRSFANVPGQPRGLLFKTLPSKHKPPRQQKMLLVASRYDNRIVKFNALTGSPLGSYINSVRHPEQLIHDPSGTEVLVSSTGPGSGNSVKQYDVNGTLKIEFAKTGTNMVFAPVTQATGAAEDPKVLLSPGPGFISKFDSTTGTIHTLLALALYCCSIILM